MEETSYQVHAPTETDKYFRTLELRNLKYLTHLSTIATIQIFIFNWQQSNWNSSVSKISWWVWSLYHTTVL